MNEFEKTRAEQLFDRTMRAIDDARLEKIGRIRRMDRYLWFIRLAMIAFVLWVLTIPFWH